jgi:5'-3' exonuclease
MKRTGLWDGDCLVWRFGWLTDHKVLVRSLEKTLEEYSAKTECSTTKIFVADTAKSNFRYKVFAGYKSSRVGKKRPPSEKFTRDYLLEHHGAIVIQGAEVDDALGIEQIRLSQITDEDSIIFTNDKDLDMIPGWHCDLDFQRKIKYKDTIQIRKAYKRQEIYEVKDPGFLSLRKNNGKNVLTGAGHLWFCAQMLIGDSADCIPGLSKLANTGLRFGPVAAFNTLKESKTYEQGIKKAYHMYIKSIPRDNKDIRRAFIRNAKLLWIKRVPGKEQVFPLEWLDQVEEITV